ncbi:MAG: iron-containing alcohol dehydrogenase family protein [Pelosinus sp.]|nr:iron-containing alcohol dehydrogenase family protein [Pelosinus sp.]
MRLTAHRISIPTILEVGKGNFGNIGKLLAKHALKKIVLFYGTGIYELFGDKISSSLASSGIIVLKKYEQDNNEVCSITRLAFSLPNDTEVIVGVGGGKVLDIAKYAAFLKNLPFISLPTSTSHDGFASSGCSLLVDGRKTSVAAQMPFGIIVDIDVIKSSPEKFIFSGIGDLLSKITAIQDWLFEEENGKAVVDDFAVMMAKKSVNSVVRTNFSSITEDFFLKELIDSLTMSGISMEIAGNSAPASGSEHLISHALDQLLAKPELHGIQVGVATYIMSMVQNHRKERVHNFLQQTGFFAHVQKLNLYKESFAEAIELAPQIKPHRYTYLHSKENRDYARQLLYQDAVLQKILI